MTKSDAYMLFTISLNHFNQTTRKQSAVSTADMRSKTGFIPSAEAKGFSPVSNYDKSPRYTEGYIENFKSLSNLSACLKV